MNRLADRGQTEPIAALTVLFGLCLGLSLYAIVLGGATGGTDRDVATPTLSRVAEMVVTAGVAHPDAVPESAAAAPAGYGMNVTLTAGDEEWSTGPVPPAGASTASRSVGVRLAPGRVRAGELRVTVWEGDR